MTVWLASILIFSEKALTFDSILSSSCTPLPAKPIYFHSKSKRSTHPTYSELFKILLLKASKCFLESPLLPEQWFHFNLQRVHTRKWFCSIGKHYQFEEFFVSCLQICKVAKEDLAPIYWIEQTNDQELVIRTNSVCDPVLVQLFQLLAPGPIQLKEQTAKCHHPGQRLSDVCWSGPIRH